MAFVSASAMTMSGAPSAPAVSRRRALRLATLAAAAVACDVAAPAPAAAKGASGRQVVNSVLSAYGLPQIRDVDGFTPLLEQYDRLVVEFQYPAAWIVARNVLPVTDQAGVASSTARLSFGTSSSPMEGRASGLTAGDYRRAEGLSFFVSGEVPPGTKNVKDVNGLFIAKLVTPGDATGMDAEVKVVRDYVDDEGYRVIDTKFESTTVSGYTVQRRGHTRATMLTDGKLYALTGSCSETRFKKIGDTISSAVQSFRVFRV